MDLISNIDEINIQDTFEPFFIHFDLEGDKHEIPIQQSIITEQSIYTIVQEFNKHLFNNGLEIIIVVYPSENGSLLKKAGIWIVTTITVAMLSDTINGVSKGLTGKSREDHVEGGTIFMKEMVQGFMEKRNQELVNTGVSYDMFYKAYDAKNKFYHAAIDNFDVKKIGFTNNNLFSVPRDEFAYRTVNLKEKTSKIESVEKIHNLIVISSINTREDSKLARQVKDEKIKKRFDIYMTDSDFYESFLANPIYLSSLLVKVRYYLNRDEDGEIQIEKKEIIKVYKYNNINIIDLPENVKVEDAPWNIGNIKDIINPVKLVYQGKNLFSDLKNEISY